jgi:hypothetical protein
MTPQLSTPTLAWLAKHPHAHQLVNPVWDRLAELERAGHNSGVIAALRFILIYHQPTVPAPVVAITAVAGQQGGSGAAALGRA